MGIHTIFIFTYQNTIITSSDNILDFVQLLLHPHKMLNNRIWMSEVPLANYLSSKCILSCKVEPVDIILVCKNCTPVWACVFVRACVYTSIIRDIEKITNFFHILKFHHQVSDWDYSQSYYPDDCNAWIIKLWKSYWSQYLIFSCSVFI